MESIHNDISDNLMMTIYRKSECVFLHDMQKLPKDNLKSIISEIPLDQYNEKEIEFVFALLGIK